MKYRFLGHFVGEPEPREVPERIIRGFYDHFRIDRGVLGAMSYAEFCETICDPHESIANSKGDFWAEKEAA